MGHRRTAHLKKLANLRRLRRVQRLADARNGRATVDAFLGNPANLEATSSLIGRLRSELAACGLPVQVANGVMLGLGIKTLADNGGSARMIYDIACAITGEPNLFDHVQGEIEHIAGQRVH